MLTDRILCAGPDMARAIIRMCLSERGAAVVPDSCVDRIIADIRERGMAAETLRAYALLD